MKKAGCPPGEIQIQGKCYPKTREIVDSLNIAVELNKIDKKLSELHTKGNMFFNKASELRQQRRELKRAGKLTDYKEWKLRDGEMKADRKHLDITHEIDDFRRQKGFLKQSLSYKLPKVDEEIRSELKRIAEIDMQMQDLTRYKYGEFFDDEKEILSELEREKETIVAPYVKIGMKGKKKKKADEITIDAAGVVDDIQTTYWAGESDMRAGDAWYLIAEAGGGVDEHILGEKKTYPITIDLNILRKLARRDHISLKQLMQTIRAWELK